jgi:transcriptional regulator with XRE-family HTH domain
LQAINLPALKDFMNVNKLSAAELSRQTRVSRAQVSRILKGERGPGTKFIAGFKRAFPDQPLEAFFFTSSDAERCHRRQQHLRAKSS